MFGDKREQARDFLVVKEGLDVKEFIRKSGDWYYFKVSSTWNGTHTVKVKEGFFGWVKETVN
ncbi:hypothetical protein H7K13_23810 [Priestia aryabhattai]|uniref:hypothetical protein n=1 Tax=Priestia aryabhattai TaxID=412384 RepID=UPI001C8CFCD5|nr:hypothetical protein [Priestia aryabhattai]MBY0077956.1 hypothetical protein [Priestia aryabhattai]